MQRENKFRAWMKEQKEMVEVEWLGRKLFQPQGYEVENVNQAVIMQYTGLKDKRSTDLYHKMD